MTLVQYLVNSLLNTILHTRIHCHTLCYKNKNKKIIKIASKLFQEKYHGKIAMALKTD